MTWLDDVDTRVFISTSGDFVSLGTRVEIPFSPGGSSGSPSGWVNYDTAGTALTDVNRTTSGGRYSISNALSTINQAKFYGAYYDFPVTVGHRYIIQVQARKMEGKNANPQRNFRVAAQPSGVDYNTFGNAQSDWEMCVMYTDTIAAGTTSIRIILQGVYYITTGWPDYQQGKVDWGVQFQNLAVIDQLGTYPSPTWQEVTCDVQQMNIKYGREKFTDRYDVATASIQFLNNDGELGYRPGDEWLRPGRFLRVEQKQKADATWLPMYYGIIDNIIEGFTMVGKATVVMSCVDTSTLLANTDVPTFGWNSSTYYSGSRFNRLCDIAAWHPSYRSASTGQFIQQAIMSSGRSIRDELGLVADSEGGMFFCDRTGILTYFDRAYNASGSVWTKVNANLIAKRDRSTAPVDGIANNTTTANIPTRELETSWSRDRVVNILTLANAGSASYSYFDRLSQQKYGPRTYQRLDFVNDPTHPEYLDTRATDIMDGFTEAILRVNRVTFKPKVDQFGVWFGLRVFLNWLVRVWYQHPTENWGFTIVSKVQGYEHSYTNDDWSLTLLLDDPVASSFFISAENWDVSLWDVGLWDEVGVESAYWSSGQTWNDASRSIWGPNTWQ